MTFNAANILTMSRLVLAPVFVVLFVMAEREAAFVVFCVAGFTDLIDGTVARMLNQPSKGGALLDPLADKLLMQSCFFLLLYAGLLPVWFFSLAFLRDAMIVAGIIYLEKKKAELPYRPTWASKFATLFQLAVAVLGLLRWWRPHLDDAGLVNWHWGAVIAATVLIVASGAQYVRMGLRLLEMRRGANR